MQNGYRMTISNEITHVIKCRFLHSIIRVTVCVTDLEAEELMGNMHRSEDVAAITDDMVKSIRAMLTALPGRLAVPAHNAESAEECSIIIRDQVYAIMEELSKYTYDSSKYEQLVRERREWSEREV